MNSSCSYRIRQFDMANRIDLVTLEAFKNNLNKTSTTSDDVIARIITRASGQANTFTKRYLRPNTYTEYYDGDGLYKLFIRHYPIISVTSLYDDLNRDFGSTYLKAATDYFVNSKPGTIELMSEAVKGTIFLEGRRNVKLTYVAGFDEFEIITGVNDSIDFKDDGGAEVSSTLDSGTYTGTALATEIKTQLDTDGAGTYTVVYNQLTGIYTVTTDQTTVQFLISTGTNAYKGVYSTIGFDADADPTAAATMTAGFGVLGVPEDIQQAAMLIALRDLNESALGSDQFDLKKKTLSAESGTGTTEYVGGKIPPQAAQILTPYKRRVI